MDQNLEGKGEEERALVAVPVPAEDVGIYLLGAHDPRSFVGYIEGGWTDEEIEEYIKMQERLRPACLKRRESQSEAEVEEVNTNEKGSASRAALVLETINEEEDEEDHTTIAEHSPSKSAGILETIFETEDEDADT